VFILKKTKQELNITFHNPNDMQVFTRELIKMYAEIAKNKVDRLLLQNQILSIEKDPHN